jgi:hypothetical protein
MVHQSTQLAELSSGRRDVFAAPDILLCFTAFNYITGNPKLSDLLKDVSVDERIILK